MLERRTLLKRSAALLLFGGVTAYAASATPAQDQPESGQNNEPQETGGTGPGVKIFLAYARRPGMTKGAFHDYWRHPHSTRGGGITGQTHFVRSHQFSTPHLGAAQGTYDGVGEWYDSLQNERRQAGIEPGLHRAPAPRRAEYRYGEHALFGGGATRGPKAAHLRDKALCA